MSPGQANATSKYAVFSEYGFIDTYRWIYFETTLYGDPETPLQVGQIGGVRGTVQTPGGQGVAGDMVFLDMNPTGSPRFQHGQSGLDQRAAEHSGRRHVQLDAHDERPGRLLTNVTVTLNMTWPWDSDLTAYLVSPAGTSVELFANVGGSGQNFTGTTLSDQAGTSIATAAAPFTGTFQPQGVLGTFDGGQPNGTWTLQINNDWNTDTARSTVGRSPSPRRNRAR